MGLKLRRFRHRLSLKPLPSLGGEVSGTIHMKTENEYPQLSEMREEVSFIGRYRRVEDGFEPEPEKPSNKTLNFQFLYHVYL